MSAWTLVPCLVNLREEYNRLAPDRDRASDGSIGDPRHAASVSDHNPDNRGLVHAIDVDNTGPWPAGLSMEKVVQHLVQRQRDGRDDRLQNVIYNRRIWSRTWGWAFRPYNGVNPHDHHAHFSARYTPAQENNTRPWGLLDLLPTEDDMAELTPANLAAIGKAAADAVWARSLSSTSTAKRWPDNPAQPASNWLLLSAIHGKDGAIADVADVQRDNILLAAVQAGQVSAQEFAEAVVAQLPQEQVQAFLDALSARLAS